MSKAKLKKEIKVTYHPVESKLEDINFALDSAFDILFENVLKDDK